MKKFFTTTLAVITGLFVWSIISTAATAIFFFAIVAFSDMDSNNTKDITKNTILHLTLDTEITDRSEDSYSQNAYLNLTNFSVSEKTIGINTLYKAIKQASTDPKISALFLDLSTLNCGAASVEEIRNMIIDFKKSGKPVFSYADSYDNLTYYLASAADQIIMNPCGGIEFKGLAMQNFYVKSALEKVGIEMQVVRHGKFKSAVEPYIQDKMSDENSLQSQTLLNDIWNNMLLEISVSRKIDTEVLNKYADELALVSNQNFCVSSGIIDSLMYRSDFLTYLQEIAGQDITQDIKTVSLNDYQIIENQKPQSIIAVIYASGEIVGDGGRGTITSKAMAKAFEQARCDDKVKAVVLRVNSPGGDASEAETILHEAEKLAAVKPFVVSMGDYAASGGYYISCLADSIFVMPNTITGSIGVFGIMPCAQKLIKNTIGINVETVKTNKHSDFMTITSPMDSKEAEVLQRSVENIYSLFIGHVANYRPLSVEGVDSIGQGRVWSGISACKNGLSDNFGGLECAIDAAAKIADIKSWKIMEYPENDNSILGIFKDILSAKLSAFNNYPKDYAKILKYAENLSKNQGVKCYMQPVVIK